MINRNQEIKERLQREFEVCNKHILRIKEALQGLGVDLPMSTDCYAHLNAEQVRCIDQFIFRFSKLQDAMGAKIFRFTLELLGEDIVALPMRDILNKLERYQMITNADEWIYIRELRNEISHDYPLQDTDVVTILNELFSKVEVLLGIYYKLEEKFPSEK